MPQTADRHLDVSNPRYWHQNAKASIRDIFDALVELITNVDDRYVVLKTRGRIEIDVERRRGGSDNIIRVRDFADGMSLRVMEEKLAKVGGRISGMAEGQPVRGTNSRGAKDVAVLGGVLFESIAGDGRYHRCEISAQGRFKPEPESVPATKEIRDQLGIPKGTGTVVTLSVNSKIATIPQHDNLREQLERLVPLRDILTSSDREVVLRDKNKKREDRIRGSQPEGHEVLDKRIAVPGYPDASAKLTVRRSKERFDTSEPRHLRRGGILVKSTHAIHEATYLAQELEHDPHAAVFFGRLQCDYLEKLWNEYDDRFERGLDPTPENPRYAIDPMRRGGLDRDHPFVKALLGEALRLFRPLVDDERRQQEKKKSAIESDKTRQRLRSLEKEAAKFMNRYRDEDEESREPDDRVPDSSFRRRGFSLSPPFAQLVVGKQVRFWFNVDQKAFPEVAAGELVEVRVSGPEISASERLVKLEPHPTQQGSIRAVWLVKGLEPTVAATVSARTESIQAESTVEVLSSEKDRFAHIKEFCFERKRYTVRTDGSRRITLLAPYPSIVGERTPFEFSCSNEHFKVTGERVLVPQPELGIALCKLRVTASKPEHKGKVAACVGTSSTEAEIVSAEPFNSAIAIKLDDVGDDWNQRAIWSGNSNTLVVAARHPALRRYLGAPPEFPGQEQPHFRVLLAEIVADAVCSRLISRTADARPDEYADYDWDAYYADYSKYMSEFLPIAHATQLKDSDARAD
ncbi:MAG: hypothetical protein WCC53_08920 [Thermoanaerobaculia bacterium]